MYYGHYNLFCYINCFDENLIKNLPKYTTIIYRNYKKKINEKEIVEIKKICKLNKNKIILSNNIKVAINLKLDGVYIPSFNKSFKINYTKKPKKFIVIGSAHNLKEIRIKEKQNVDKIFLSPIFKKNYRNQLGIYKVLNFKKITKKQIVALGGLSKDNYKLIKLIGLNGIAGISFFKSL